MGRCHEGSVALSVELLACDLAGSPDCRIHRWKLVLHLVNHATLHRGQVTSMLRQVGQKPPNTDTFTYALRDRS
jgi:uncharacterized damage-inducible protein DinB